MSAILEAAKKYGLKYDEVYSKQRNYPELTADECAAKVIDDRKAYALRDYAEMAGWKYPTFVQNVKKHGLQAVMKTPPGEIVDKDISRYKARSDELWDYQPPPIDEDYEYKNLLKSMSRIGLNYEQQKARILNKGLAY